jgi:hypothetical protein
MMNSRFIHVSLVAKPLNRVGGRSMLRSSTSGRGL